MKLIARFAALPHALALAAALALAGCGHSDKASDAAAPDNVEMPAEEAMSGLEPSAMPASDANATATDAATAVEAAPVEAASSAAPVAKPAAVASKAAKAE